MSLLRSRRLLRALSLLLVLVSLRGMPYLDGDDLACLPIVEEHDGTRHGIRSGAPHAPEHCAVCHLARSLRAPRPALTLSLTQPTGIAPVLRDGPAAPRAAVVEHLPARAPPARL